MTQQQCSQCSGRGTIYCPWCERLFCSNHGRHGGRCPTSGCDGITQNYVPGAPFQLIGTEAGYNKMQRDEARKDREEERNRERDESRARKLVSSARSDADRGNYTSMIRKLSTVLDELSHTSVRRDAEHWLKFAQREHAETLYDKAVTAFDRGSKTRGATALKELINDFPDTPAAERAQEFLDDEVY